MSESTNTSQSRPDVPRRFVSIGECMVEMAPAGQEDAFRLGFAGDTFNTAWYVKALAPDWQSRYVSRVGQDAVSDRMVAFMQQAGIDTDHVLRCPDRSVGLYLISLADGERSFSYWRDRSAARLLAEDRAALEAAAADADIVYFSGITLAILDPEGRRSLLAVLREARGRGRTVVFDPNLRPRLWTSASEMTQTVMQAAAVADIALPSFDDEAVHFGDADPAATRQRYSAAGATTVVVKNGPGTIHYLRGGVQGEVMAQPVGAVVDTTSAGDSFNAGLLVGLERAGSTEAAIEFAARVARHVIAQRGALVALPEGLGG